MTVAAGRQDAAPAWSANRGMVALAVGYQWFYNGANFLAFKVAGDALHPLMVATLRFLIAGLILLPVALARRSRGRASLGALGRAAVIGIIMLVASQALAIWGTHFLPAGVASVFGSAPPLFLAVFAWVLFRQALSRRQVAGVLVSFVGLALMGWSSVHAGGFHPQGAVMTLAASAFWAWGSLLATRLDLPEDPVVALTAQVLAAGLLLAVVVVATGVLGGTHWERVPLSAWSALVFLIVASTLIGYAVFLAINAQVSSTLANTFNYVAPVIALGLSALLLRETLTLMKVAAAAIALGGVALMIGGRSEGSAKASGGNTR